ncbi:MAG: Uma2 family endonuclease [Cyanobacteria bacterium P01_C01_bin.70]
MVAQLPKVPSFPHQTLIVTWDSLPDDYVLPDDPVENLQQPLLAAALTDALGEAGWIQPHMLIASNFGLVATVAGKTVVKAPDWLYVPQANPVSEGVIRRSYTPHAEGTPVAVVMEFLSETETGEYSLRPVFPYGKMFFYQNILQVPTYILFDSASVTLHVFHLESDVYQPAAANQEGRIWIPAMQLFIGTWQGTRLGTTTHWLRWWDAENNMLLWSSEQAAQASQRAEEERQRAEKLAAKLRALGIEPNDE